jgi:hypothetical protein
MEDKILKQIEEEAFRRFPVELTRDKVDENSYRRKVFTENCEWYHNNIKESVDEKNLIRDAQLLAAKEIREYWRSLKKPDNEFYNNHSIIIDSSIVSCIEIIEKCVLSATKNTVSNEWEKWVSVNDRTPHAWESGNWDGKRSDKVLCQDSKGEYHIAEVYEGTLDGSRFVNWYDSRDYEIDNVVKWKEIN